MGGGAGLCREGACRRADGGGSRGVLRVDEPAVQQPHPQQVEDEQVLRVLQPVHGVKAHVDVEPAAELREERLRGEAGEARGCALGRANRAGQRGQGRREIVGALRSVDLRSVRHGVGQIGREVRGRGLRHGIALEHVLGQQRRQL